MEGLSLKVFVVRRCDVVAVWCGCGFGCVMWRPNLLRRRSGLVVNMIDVASKIAGAVGGDISRECWHRLNVRDKEYAVLIAGRMASS